jgi:hypothetical protein
MRRSVGESPHTAPPGRRKVLLSVAVALTETALHKKITCATTDRQATTHPSQCSFSIHVPTRQHARPLRCTSRSRTTAALSAMFWFSLLRVCGREFCATLLCRYIQNNSELSEDLLVLRAASSRARDRPPSRRTRTRERASLPPWSASSASGTRARCHCLVPQGARDDGRGESVSVFDHWTRLCDHPKNGFNTHRR